MLNGDLSTGLLAVCFCLAAFDGRLPSANLATRFKFNLTPRRTNGKFRDSLQGGKAMRWTVFEKKKLLATSQKTQHLFDHEGHEAFTKL
jgi:hypothetical protein